MGVPGLWEILRPAAQTRSLTHLAVVDGFQANPGGVRGLRIGIDASIWFFHAAYGREGENPELRTLFFRCARLMSMPFLPLFVFDGPKRPNVKRGKRITGKNHWLVNGMKEIIEAFGFEWRMAPGEAEAELAYLNRIGVIDAILSDDVDNFLFGARMVIRNPSTTLSGNRSHSLKNSAGKNDGNHSAVFTSDSILTHPSVGLSRGGLILIGLLSGGDYHQAGLPRCGPNIACGLAKCGFGDQLLEAAHSIQVQELPEFLDRWRESLRHELRTNSSGHLGTKKPSLAKAVDDEFPNIDVLLSYAKPITSENDENAKRKHVPPNWQSEPDLGKIAHLCEIHFEWGIRDIIIKRFRTVLWPSAVLRLLRQIVLKRDTHATPMPPSSSPSLPIKSLGLDSTPSKVLAHHISSMHLEARHREDASDNLVVKVHSTRSHASTDGIVEFRLEIAPAELVRLCNSGIQGIRKPVDTTFDIRASDTDDVGADDDQDTGSFPDPESHIRIWIPACIVELAVPRLVREFENKTDASRKRGTGKAPSAQKKAPVNRKERKQPLTKTTSRVKDAGVNSSHASSTSQSLERQEAAELDILPRTQPSSSSKLGGELTSNLPTFVGLNVRRNHADRRLSTPVYDLSSDSDSTRNRNNPPVKNESRRSKDSNYLKTTTAPSFRPFPMTFTDEELGSSDDENVLPGPLSQSSVYSLKKQKDVSLSYRRRPDSELSTPRPSKSPRKSTLHVSPTKQRKDPAAIRNSKSDSRTMQAAYSPASEVRKTQERTPTSSVARLTGSGDSSVIEISSGSDADDDLDCTTKMAPLMLARSRAARVSASRTENNRQQNGVALTREVVQQKLQNEQVIDLTE